MTMGDRARRWILDRFSPGERFDRGLELSDRTIESYLSDAGAPPDDSSPDDPMSDEDRRRRFEALRAEGS